MRFGVSGLGFRGLGFKVWGFGFGVYRFRVWGLGFIGFRVQGRVRSSWAERLGLRAVGFRVGGVGVYGTGVQGLRGFGLILKPHNPSQTSLNFQPTSRCSKQLFRRRVLCVVPCRTSGFKSSRTWGFR